MKYLPNLKAKTYPPKVLKKKKSYGTKSPRNLELSSLVYFVLIFFSILELGLNTPVYRKKGVQIPIQSNQNEITMIISGTGEQPILGYNYSFCPNKIYLDGNEITINQNNCSLINIPEGGSERKTVKLMWDNNLGSLHGMFERMTNLLEVDFSNFDSSSAVHMTQMFLNCTKLTSINFANFRTSLVEDMHLTFGDCQSLEELDLSSFDTSKVTTMYFMFAGCNKLKSLNLENFNTAQVETMEAMFYNLTSLESVNIRNFDTSKVRNMGFMFAHDVNLKNLDLSHFNTANVHVMEYMFSATRRMTC